MARPTDYSEELVDQICSRIAEGMSIAAASDGLAGQSTVYRWLAEYSAFREKYTRARELRADSRFERIDQVIADMRAGTVDHQQARVEIDAIKWQAGKEMPLRYGERSSMELSGPGGAPVQSEHKIMFVEVAAVKALGPAK